MSNRQCQKSHGIGQYVAFRGLLSLLLTFEHITCRSLRSELARGPIGGVQVRRPRRPTCWLWEISDRLLISRSVDVCWALEHHPARRSHYTGDFLSKCSQFVTRRELEAFHRLAPIRQPSNPSNVPSIIYGPVWVVVNECGTVSTFPLPPSCLCPGFRIERHSDPSLDWRESAQSSPQMSAMA